MSFQAMTWAVQQKLPTNQKIVLIMLANRVNHDTGRCIPRIKALAEECGMSETTCKSALKALAERGLITIEARFDEGVQKPNQYHLHLHQVANSPPPGGGSKSDPVGLEAHGVGRIAPGGGSKSDPGVGRNPPTEPGSFEPVIEPEDKAPTGAKKSRVLVIECPHGVDAGVWRDFRAMRDKLRAPLTETAWKGFVREAEKAAMPLNDVLELCCQRGWRGFNAGWVRDLRPAANDNRRSTHHGFRELDYTAGVDDDGNIKQRA